MEYIYRGSIIWYCHCKKEEEEEGVYVIENRNLMCHF